MVKVCLLLSPQVIAEVSCRSMLLLPVGPLARPTPEGSFGTNLYNYVVYIIDRFGLLRFL